MLLDRIKAQIVAIRREGADDAAWTDFSMLVEENVDEIVESFDTRWLTSICETYADHADPISARNAMLISIIVKMEKIAQTYVHWRLAYPGSLEVDPEQPHRKLRLWDGMSSFHLDIGDAPNTMFGRMDRLLTDTPALRKILNAVKERMRTGDTIMGSLNRRHGHVFETDFSWILNPNYESLRTSGRIPAHRRKIRALTIARGRKIESLARQVQRYGRTLAAQLQHHLLLAFGGRNLI